MAFISGPDGDLKTAFVSDAWLLDQFVGNTLYCCGYNFYGQLGDSTTTDRSFPVQTIAQGNNWKDVSFGYYHIQAIKVDGTLWGWGNNNTYGQLGDNTTLAKNSPVQTTAFGTNWKQVACGGLSSLSVKTDGTLWGWGFNGGGQLGDNTTTNKSSPVQTVTFAKNWKQVSAGAVHVAAIKNDGTLWCWGGNKDNTNFNSYGQLGDNTTVNKSSPIQTIAYGTNWKTVSCGYYFTTAIKNDGTLWSWGLNDYGQLGDNTTSSKSSPVQTVAFGTSWKQVSAGRSHTTAIKVDGTLWCWGYNSFYGQLGDNTTLPKSSPIQTITYGTNWKNTCVGFASYTTTAIKTDGSLWCWGDNTKGQLGDNTRTSKSSPIQTLLYGTNWKKSTCGYQSIAAVTNGDI